MNEALLFVHFIEKIMQHLKTQKKNDAMKKH